MKSPLVLTSERLRISFRRGAQDRFDHVVELVTDGHPQTMLESIEGQAEESWPGSPPFQEAHLEQRPGGRQVVLLVGMAGSSHWSASVEIDPQTSAAVFDVACRMRGRADRLGSRYQIQGDQRPSQPRQIWLAPHPSPAAAGCELALCLELLATGDPATLGVEMGAVSVALGAVESTNARTVRWRYAVSAVAVGPGGK